MYALVAVTDESLFVQLESLSAAIRTILGEQRDSLFEESRSIVRSENPALPCIILVVSDEEQDATSDKAEKICNLARTIAAMRMAGAIVSVETLSSA